MRKKSKGKLASFRRAEQYAIYCNSNGLVGKNNINYNCLTKTNWKHFHQWGIAFFLATFPFERKRFEKKDSRS